MIERDRVLFARVARLNSTVGKVVGGMLSEFSRGLPPASGVRALGEALRDVADDLLMRAAELDRGNLGARRGPRQLPVGADGFSARSSSPGSTVPVSHPGETAEQEGQCDVANT